MLASLADKVDDRCCCCPVKLTLLAEFSFRGFKNKIKFNLKKSSSFDQ
jgi:hypothetical protein